MANNSVLRNNLFVKTILWYYFIHKFRSIIKICQLHMLIIELFFYSTELGRRDSQIGSDMKLWQFL